MADVDQLNTDPECALYDALNDIRTGMLGLKGSEQHMQPMTHFADQDAGKIRFVTARDTDLAQALTVNFQAKQAARFTVVSKGQDFHACIDGTLEQVVDPQTLKDLWSPVLGAWFDGGPEDPDVVLLEFTPTEAAMWASTGNPLRFGYEIAKANMNDDAKPDLGSHVVHTFVPAKLAHPAA